MFKKIWTGICWLAEHLLALVALVTGLAAVAIFGPLYLFCIAALAVFAVIKAVIPAGIVYACLYLAGVPEYIAEPIAKIVWGLFALGAFAALLAGEVGSWGSSPRQDNTTARSKKDVAQQTEDDFHKGWVQSYKKTSL